jgi:hypothetical protein
MFLGEIGFASKTDVSKKRGEEGLIPKIVKSVAKIPP